MNEDLKKLHESKNYDELYTLIETKFSQFESRWNSVLVSEEGVDLYRNTKLPPDIRDTIYRKMFAELLIRECARVIDRGDGAMSSMAETSWCNICRDDILKHFGVEE
jgi:hypothetical protein